ncbi:solute carrier family 35 member F4 isoform X2 [Scyliorhinus torazame]|uniref:solute carrier family 35 member F4 isoform X2 n=1 Tax=Scyliorhinus torazame TaxID=75743 RepID=UPI003B5BA4BE
MRKHSARVAPLTAYRTSVLTASIIEGEEASENRTENLNPDNNVKTRCQSCTSAFFKIFWAFLVILSVSSSWVGTTQIVKVTYKNFHCPFFMTWFSTNWNIMFFPVYYSGHLASAPEKQTLIKKIRECSRIFGEEGLTLRLFVKRTAPFSILWTLTNYLYLLALKKLTATDVSALFCCNKAFVFLLSWIVLKDRFMGVRELHDRWCEGENFVQCFKIMQKDLPLNHRVVQKVTSFPTVGSRLSRDFKRFEIYWTFKEASDTCNSCTLKHFCLRQETLGKVAAIMAITGIVMMAYADGFHGDSIIGVALAVGSASTSALYKVLFKMFLGSANFGEAAYFISTLGFFNLIFISSVPVILYFTKVEYWSSFSALPWGYLCGIAGLWLAFNILVNVGVVLTYPLLISIGTVLSVPGNAAVDLVKHEVIFSMVRLTATTIICIGFLLMLLPEEWDEITLRFINRLKEKKNEEQAEDTTESSVHTRSRSRANGTVSIPLA